MLAFVEGFEPVCGVLYKEDGRGRKQQQKDAFGGKKEEKVKGVRKGRLVSSRGGVLF